MFRGINAFAAEISYSNVSRYLGTKLTRTNSNQIYGNLHCQLRNAGIKPLIGNGVAGAQLMSADKTFYLREHKIPH